MSEGAVILEKILSSVSRGLGIAGQLIPLYQESEPLIKGARELYNNLKDKKKDDIKIDLPEKKPYPMKKDEATINKSLPIEKEKAKNSPQFFI